MQNPHYLIRVLHVAHKCIPGTIHKAIAKSGDHKADHEKWVRRVAGGDNVADEMGRRAHNGDASTAKAFVDEVVDQGCEDVAREGG